MPSLPERVATLEGQLKGIAMDVLELQGDYRELDKRVDDVEQAEHRRDERERRAAAIVGLRFAVAGIALTAFNIAVAAVAIFVR